MKALVIGGSSNLASELSTITPRDYLCVAANHHFASHNIYPHYICYIDDFNKPRFNEQRKILEAFQCATTISNQPNADIVFKDFHKHGIKNSGMLAVYFALKLTQDEVLLAGFNFYKNSHPYHHLLTLLYWQSFLVLLGPARNRLTRLGGQLWIPIC